MDRVPVFRPRAWLRMCSQPGGPCVRMRMPFQLGRRSALRRPRRGAPPHDFDVRAPGSSLPSTGKKCERKPSLGRCRARTPGAPAWGPACCAWNYLPPLLCGPGAAASALPPCASPPHALSCPLRLLCLCKKKAAAGSDHWAHGLLQVPQPANAPSCSEDHCRG